MGSPCDGTKLPQTAPREVMPLERRMVGALAEALPTRCRALVLLSARTGLRQGECFALSVDCSGAAATEPSTDAEG
jgi:hypothetical protein